MCILHFLFKVLIIKAHFIDLCYRNGLNAARFLPSYTVIISNIAFSLMVSLAYDHNEGWWKGMKQFLPAKSVEHEETPVRYSSSEVNHLSPREVTTMLQTDSAGNYSTARKLKGNYSSRGNCCACCKVLWYLQYLLSFSCVGDELVSKCRTTF